MSTLNQLIFTYTATDISGKPVKSFYAYAKPCPETGGYMCDDTTGTTQEQLANLLEFRYGYTDIQVTVQDAGEYFDGMYDKGKFLEISEDDFDELYECLPPERLLSKHDFFVFRVMEPITETLSTFCIQKGKRYFRVTERRSIPYYELEANLKTFLDQPAN